MGHPVRFYYSHRRYTPPLEGAPALEVQALSVAHQGSTQAAVVNADLSIEVGERVALIGANGAGKSSLLKAIAGLLRPKEGRIRIFGLPIGACHHRVAYLPQRGDIDWRFPISVQNLVVTGRYVHIGWLRRPGPQDRLRAIEVLEHLGMHHLANRQIGELSGGQQQRVLLARALVQEADLLLLDEPFNAVDAATRDVIVMTIDELQNQGKTIVVATHDLDRLAADFDRVVTLHDGQIVSDRPSALHDLEPDVMKKWSACV